MCFLCLEWDVTLSIYLLQIGSAVAVIKHRNGNQLKPRTSLSDVVAPACPCSHPVGWTGITTNKDSELLCILLPLVCNNRVCDFAQKASKCHSTLVARTDKLWIIRNSLLAPVQNAPIEMKIISTWIPDLLQTYNLRWVGRGGLCPNRRFITFSFQLSFAEFYTSSRLSRNMFHRLWKASRS